MADELIINQENDRVFIKSLDEVIFRSRIKHFLKNGYTMDGEIEISKHGLCKARSQSETSANPSYGQWQDYNPRTTRNLVLYKPGKHIDELNGYIKLYLRKYRFIK